MHVLLRVSEATTCCLIASCLLLSVAACQGTVTSEGGTDGTPAGATPTISPPSVALGSSLATFTWTITYPDGADVALQSQSVLVDELGVACASPQLAGAGVSYSVEISGCTGDGSVAFHLPPATATLAGVAAQAVSAAAAIVDNARPTPALGAPDPTIGNASTRFSWSVTFPADAVVDFTDAAVHRDESGVTCDPASVTGPGPSYVVTIGNCAGGGAIGFSLDAGLAQDGAGNASAAVSSSLATVDNLRPTPSIGQPNPGNGNSSTTFSWPVVFPASAIVSFSAGGVEKDETGVSCAPATVAGANLSYTVSISSCTGDGSVGFHIVAGSATDAAGNTTAAAASPMATVDNTTPDLL